MERGLSLNFGRAPTLSDYDISTPYPPPLSGEAAIHDLVTIWLDHTRVQSRMYQELYSAQGQLASQEQKTASVRKLVAELQELRRRCGVRIFNHQSGRMVTYHTVGPRC